MRTVVLGTLMIASVIRAQDNPSSWPSFDVASIRLDDSVAPGHLRVLHVSCAHDTFVARDVSVWYLIKWAWNITADNDRLVGYPAWTTPGGVGENNEYNIEAKGAAPVSEERCRLMIRALLTDRFQLRAHEEKRLIDAFDLVIAKGGPKISKVTDPNAPINGPGFNVGGQKMQIMDPKLQGWTMDQVATALGFPMARLGRKVFNRTGLDGIYRIDLSFRRPADTEGAGPDVTTALREQLGLALKTAKEPLDVVVVDHVERPTPN